MTDKKRIEYIDLAKGICIILVVLLHVVPEIGKGSFLVNLRMPLYFCLSGLFFKTYSGINEFTIKKIDKLIIPFMAWYLISYAIYYLRVFLLGYPEHIFRITDLFLEKEFYNGSLWFLLSLFWCNLFFYLVHKVSKNEWIQGSLILILASLGWILSYLEMDNFLYLGTSLTCLPFFYLGRQMFTKNIISSDKNLRKDILLFGISFLILISVIWLPIEKPEMLFYLNLLSAGNPITLYVSGITLITCLLIVCKYIKRIPGVSYLGRFSIIVLVTHGLLNNVMTRSIEHFTGIDMGHTKAHLLLFMAILGLMFVIIPLGIKFLPHICAQKPVIENIKVKKEAYL